jgi:hypothetical protein
MSKDCECASAQGNTLSILDCELVAKEPDDRLRHCEPDCRHIPLPCFQLVVLRLRHLIVCIR